MQHHAPPALAVRIDQFADLRIEPGLPQRLDEKTALPVAIARHVPMLRLASAAHAEMPAHRRDTLGARVLDAQQMAAVGMAGKRLDLRHLAGQRIGHIHRPLGRLRDTVAAMADAGNRQAFGHEGAATISGR